MDPAGIGELLGGIAAMGGLWWSVRVGLDRNLRACQSENEALKERISALLTELVVMRKLVPAGEWAEILARHDLAP